MRARARTPRDVRANRGPAINIVFVQRIFHPNTLGWVRGFQQLGHDVTVLVKRDAAEAPRGVCRVLEMQDLPWLDAMTSPLLGGNSRLVLPHPWRLWRMVSELRPDLVLVKAQGNSIVNQGPHVMAVSVIAALRGVRRLSWGNRPAGRTRKECWLGRAGIMPRVHVRAVSEEAGSIVTSSASEDAEPFIPYAVTQSVAARNRWARDQARLRILTVAKYRSERKRPLWTLTAARRAGLLDGRAQFTFVGVGSPDDRAAREITRLATEAGVGDLVSLRFDVPYAEMESIYAEHDVLVVPGRDEPYGMVVAEAMAHGLAVVASSTVGAKYLIVPGETGLIFDSGDVDELGHMLAWLVADRQAVDAMGQRGRELVARHVAPPARARDLLHAAGLVDG